MRTGTMKEYTESIKAGRRADSSELDK